MEMITRTEIHDRAAEAQGALEANIAANAICPVEAAKGIQLAIAAMMSDDMEVAEEAMYEAEWHVNNATYI